MRISTIPRLKRKIDRCTVWHKKFAWLPTKVGWRDYRWLEYVLRKGTFHYSFEAWSWDYQPYLAETD